MLPTDGRAHAHDPSLRDVFDRDSLADTRVRVDAHRSVYATGDDDDSMYLIETGQVKVSMTSAEGKDCLLAIYTSGDVFGESCFAGTGKRFESATAMQPTLMRRASRRDFLAAVESASSMELLLQHLASRVAERQFAVFDLVTMESERRLAKILLDFGERFGAADGEHLKLEPRISHEELSQIIGTTRPRVTAFIQHFRRLDLVQTEGRAMRIHRQNMLAFLARER